MEVAPNPGSFLTRRQEAIRLWRRFREGPVKVGEQLWIRSLFWPLPYRGSRWGLGGLWVNQLNQKFAVSTLQDDFRALGLRKPVLVVGSAHALPLLRHIPHSSVVYHCSDDFSDVPGFPDSFAELESELCKQADAVVTTSEELRRGKSELNPKTYTVTNAADVSHFARARAGDTEIPEEIASLPRPVVGYVGSVFQWIEQEWLEHAAERFADWSFVLIGPLQTNVSKLSRHRNVHLLGPRPYQSLPGYLKGFDVATVPFIIDDLTRRASPIKFYEYLAAGLPIVASRLPDLEPLRSYAYLVEDREEFARALQEAVAEEGDEKRRSRMLESGKHSWEARCEQLDSILDQL